MVNKSQYRNLKPDEIQALQNQCCTAADWNLVKVAESFDTSRIQNTSFIGTVKIGNLSGSVTSSHGITKNAGIYNAAIADCVIADNVRIANVAVHIANYDIGQSACIEDVGTIQANPGASFGNGLEIKVLNEAGGRDVIIFDELSSQFAYMTCLYRYRPNLVDKLNTIARNYAQAKHSDRGCIGPDAHICSAREIIDVNIGPAATVNGTASLKNGTILSAPDAPTVIGSQVIAKNFIIAEGSSVTEAAILAHVFVGQGCKVAKQFSAENCVFFANCETLRGEACSIFAGPYTVTHHKSTLLIAGLFSFFNAGSGTNQSNHMYKLGPVHEGKLQRGTKTGSSSYMMWPCVVGPFSVILGQHSGTFDTSDQPFSLIHAAPNGTTYMVPGQNLTSVGIVRDGAKWPTRDKRKGSIKRDKISFAVLSPYTVGKMIKGSAILKQIQDTADISAEEVNICGARVKHPILHTGQEFYKTGIEMYLYEKIFEKAEQQIANGLSSIDEIFAHEPDALYSPEWNDIAGLLCPRARTDALCNAVEKGEISTIENFNAALDDIDKAYSADEWLWVKNTYKDRFDIDLQKASEDELLKITQAFLAVKTKYLRLIQVDAQKEFSEVSRTGFGQDGKIEDIQADFEQVRGTFEENSFVNHIQTQIDSITQRVETFTNKLKSI